MADEVDVAALFARLKDELRAAGPRGDGVPPAEVRLSRARPGRAALAGLGRAADRRQGRPAQDVLRRLMRWYVEPAFADQRAFNDAVLKLIDDLDERITRLEQRP